MEFVQGHIEGAKTGAPLVSTLCFAKMVMAII